MASTSVQRFYRYHARVYDKTRWMILHSRREAVDHLQLTSDASVLEVGCGTGLNFRFVLDRLDGQRGHLTGLDFSADMLVQARNRVASRGWSNVDLVEGDASTMSLGRQFDGILFAYSLTMIPDWGAALERAREHLRPGGRLVVLDFSTFLGWGPLAPLMRLWLRSCHVETQRPYVDHLRTLFPALHVRHWLGGYNFIAVGTR